MPTFYFNYTSKSRNKCVNTFINDFLQNFIPFLKRILSKNREWLSFDLMIHFTPGEPRFQNLLDSNLDYWLRITSSTGSMISSVQKDLRRPEPSFWTASPVTSIFFKFLHTIYVPFILWMKTAYRWLLTVWFKWRGIQT